MDIPYSPEHLLSPHPSFDEVRADFLPLTQLGFHGKGHHTVLYHLQIPLKEGFSHLLIFWSSLIGKNEAGNKQKWPIHPFG